MHTTDHHAYSIDHLSCIARGPFLGMDWGRKRVGLAISNPENTVSMPLCVVQTGAMLRATLNQAWHDYAIQALIIGWPVHANGQTSPMCAPILRLAHRLHHEHNWPIALWDERFTTRGVNAVIIDKKNVVDDHAAALILEGAMTRWRNIRKASQV